MSQQVQQPRRWFRFTNWTTGDYVGLVGGIVGTAGVVVAYLSWDVASKSLDESRESRQIAADAQALSQKTYDRAAGRIGVRLAIEGYLPEFERIDPRLIYRDRDGFGGVRLTSINDMRELNPRLVVRNLGEEPVEALRVECKVTVLPAHQRNLPPEREYVHYPFMAGMGETERVDYQPGKSLAPGTLAIIPLTRVFMEQMVRAQKHHPGVEDLWAKFQIRCYARLVGSTAYDNFDKDRTITRRIGWVRAGFKDDDCKEYIENDKAVAEVTPDGW